MVKEIYGDIKKNDTLKKIISDLNDEYVIFLSNFGKIIWKTRRKARKKRMKKSTSDTSLAIERTCNGLIDIYRLLLSIKLNFFSIGEFITEHLEN